MYRPPPPAQLRPLRPAAGPVDVPRQRYPYSAPYRASTVPHIPPKEPPSNRPPMLPSDQHYYQNYPGYGRGDYDHRGCSSSSSSFAASSSTVLEKRAVINYDHQSLIREDDHRGRQSTAVDESGRQRNQNSEERKLLMGRKNLVASTPNSASAPVNIDLIKTAIVSLA